MIILADTNLVIQLYFIIGAQAIGSTGSPRLEIHSWVRDELVGLCKTKPHLTSHQSAILRIFPVTNLKSPHKAITDEIDYLQGQYDAIRIKGKEKLGAAPSNIDYTQLALASLHNCGLATLEHTLLALARTTLQPGQCMTLEPLIKDFIKCGAISVAKVVEGADAMPKEERLRVDDAKYIQGLRQSLPKNSTN